MLAFPPKRLKHSVALINQLGASGLEYVGLEHVESWTGRLLEQAGADEDAEITSARAFLPGDVMFGKLRPYLAKAFVASKPGQCSSELLVLRPHEYDPTFLKYLLLERGFVHLVDSSTYGAKMPRASWDFIGNVPLPLPPLPTQKKTANFLDRKTAAIDALIEKKEKLLVLLAEKRAALINQAVTKGLDPNVPMMDSGIPWIGEIPAHWEVKPLRAILQARGEYNRGPKTKQLLSVLKDVGVVRYEDRGEGGNKSSDNIQQYKIICEGDIVLNRMNAIFGSLGISRYYGAASIEYYVLRPTDESTLTDFYAHLFNTRLFQQSLMGIGRGILAHRMRIPFVALKQQMMPVPPRHEQKTICTDIERYDENTKVAVTKLQGQNDLLKEYRQALITAAVTGQIDVTKEDD